MKTIVYAHAKTVCLYCGQRFSLAWLCKTEELPVFIASRRLYEAKKSEIVEHQNGCMRDFMGKICWSKKIGEAK